LERNPDMADMQELIKQLALRAQEQQKKELKDAHDKRIEDLTKILSTLYDKAAAYTNLIMAAGYAAFFAVWANMKTLMSPTQMRVSALAMTLSLFVFVGWELTKMIRTSFNLKKQLDLTSVEQQEFIQKLMEYQKVERAFNVKFLDVWPYVLVAAIVPALVAVGTLLLAFGVGLFAESNIAL
jgi:hypothetical protein